ncbi:MAG: arginine--tRNA ligase [Clostridiales bacterium]|jgi:arginyl-tRNA synthetase|nr:arginine--tRNA ligase [Clostridiales bacterium]
MIDYKIQIADVICKHISEVVSPDDIIQAPSPDKGDLAFPCFRLAKTLKKSPAVIAAELAEKISLELPEFVEKVEPLNAYLNFFLWRDHFAKKVTNEIFEKGKQYGSSNIGEGKLVPIDYSSPNIAKHFHVGHLGTTLIGHALYNIFNFLGYKAIGINYLGDWGTQFGKMITAYKKWGNKEEIDRRGIDGLTEIYVRFHDEVERDPGLNDEARAWMLKMQNQDEEALSLWKWFVNLSLKEYERVYKRLGITFESYRGESYYNDKMDAVVTELAEKNLLIKSEGAMIVDLSEYNMPPCLILRGDGGTLYPTRDIAAALDRKKTYNFYKSLYVTALDQNLHFAQWMKVVDLMGYDWAKDMVHIPYGLVVFEEGKLSTRKGNVIKMEDLLNEAVAKTFDIINEKNPELPDKNEVAELVGVGAVIFNQMYNNRIKDVMFSWKRMLNFDGETGPYVQYTHARACSVLEKGKYKTFSPSLLGDDYSYEVIKALNDFPGRVIEAHEKYEPFIISRCLVAIAQAYNKFYHNNIILSDDLELTSARLALTDCVRIVIETGLALLGIKAPSKM